MPKVITQKQWGSTRQLMRDWATFFRDSMLASGWVQTADTGQLDPTAIDVDPNFYQDLGYMVFTLDDQWRQSSPIYLRTHLYWSNVGGTGNSPTAKGPQINLIVGFATNGAGEMSTPVVGSGTCAAGQFEVTFKPSLEIFASGEGWASIAHGIGFAYSTQNYNYARQICMTSIERGRNEDGSINLDRLHVIFPEGAKPNAMDPTYLAHYYPWYAPGNGAQSNPVRLMSYVLDKNKPVVGPIMASPGSIGTPSASGLVDGVIQAQPVWQPAPRIAPHVSLLLVPSANLSVAQEFTAALDGVNEYGYVNLGASTGPASTPGAMYAIDCWNGPTFCPAMRVE